MRAIMVMFDSLNKLYLSPYGCEQAYTPNFDRLAQKAVTFDNFYVSSLPCMPARRDLHTGRSGFLHRSWGPLEPFDNSMPEILKDNGIYTRLISDHGHYWEDGGCTYHNRYSTWECVRGQEADPWSWKVSDPHIPEHHPTMREFTHPEWWWHSWHNKDIIHSTGEWPQNLVFDKGIEFLNENHTADNWFVQIETFDPHEPFDSPDEFMALYKDDYEGPHFDWPPYAPVTEDDAVVAHARTRYAALVSMCDRNLGRVLDIMDQYDMWEDTMLIVNTDHGFMLGEKDWWAKSVMPCYNELANTPFFLWEPHIGAKAQRRRSLCQSIDIPATLLAYFGVDIPAEMQGKSLLPVIREDTPIRKYAIYGFHGSFVNITDGRYTYMRAATSVANTPLNEYTLMPTHQQGFFTTKELCNAEIIEALPFTKGCRLMRIPNVSRLANATFCNSFQYGSLLWDLYKDPHQQMPVDNPVLEAKMLNALIEKMRDNDAPSEQFTRLGIKPDIQYDEETVRCQRENIPTFDSFAVTKRYKWTSDAKNMFIGLLSLLPETRNEEYFQAIDEVMENSKDSTVRREHFELLTKRFYSPDPGKNNYFLNKLARIR